MSARVSVHYLPYCLCDYYLGIDAVGYFCWAYRPHDDRYKIKIEVPGGVPESATILRSTEPGKTAALLARVYDQNNQLVPNVNVKLEVDVIPNSGGHQHPNAPDRPKGSLSNGVTAGPIVTGSTGNNGMPFTFLAPASAGDHKITASCTDRTCTPEGPNQVWVGVKELEPLSPSLDYALIGETNSHLDNHYLTNRANWALTKLAIDYNFVFKFTVPSVSVLNINDASLERGGIFDIKDDWKRPHAEHCMGTVVDIRANDEAGAISTENRNIFEETARRYGMDPLWEVPVTNGKQSWNLRHYHVRLLGQEGLQCPR